MCDGGNVAAEYEEPRENVHGETVTWCAGLTLPPFSLGGDAEQNQSMCKESKRSDHGKSSSSLSSSQDHLDNMRGLNPSTTCALIPASSKCCCQTEKDAHQRVDLQE